MNVASPTAPRWVVSTRTRGEIVTAGVAAPGIEVVVLGVPAGFTPDEIEGWLRDLCGVAAETSRSDTRAHAIPPLLHHALTGLLFSQSELWSQLDDPAPCSVAFIETPTGGAFGWVGDAHVHLMLEGEPLEPQWVVVRDDEGREARAAVVSADGHYSIALEYAAGLPPGHEAPAAVEAEWIPAGRDTMPAGDVYEPVRPTFAEPPAEAAAALPEPGMPVEALAYEAQAPLADEMPQEAIAAEHAPEPLELPSETALQEPVAFAPKPIDHGRSVEVGSGEHGAMLDAGIPAPFPRNRAEASRPHPVARWLGKLLGFGRRPEPAPAHTPAHTPDAIAEQPPVSAYDELISPAAESAGEQTTIAFVPFADELEAAPMAEPPAIAESAPMFEPAALAEPAPQPERVIIPPLPPGLASPRGPVAASPRAPAHETMPASGREPHQIPLLPSLRPSAPPASLEEIVQTHRDVMRQMNEVDATTLPMLAATPTPPSLAPIEVERDPHAADSGFAIPRVPTRSASPAAPSLTPPPPTAAAPPTPPPIPVSEAPSAPPAPPIAPTPAPPAAPRVLEGPSGPPVLRVSPQGAVPAVRPVVRVNVADAPASAPPVIQVTPPPAASQVSGGEAAPVVERAPVLPEAAPPSSEGVAPGEAALALTGVDELDGFLGVSHVPVARPRRAWPLPEQPEPVRRGPPPRLWIWGAIVAVVFGAGWLLGVVANTPKDEPGPLARALNTVGLGPGRFTVAVNSSPNGAWIAIDGKDTSKRTPASVDMPPGNHVVTLSVPSLGGVRVPVHGRKGQKLSVNEVLDGGLEVYAPDPSVPIAVSLDGRAQGYAPLNVEALPPGLHELQFSGPGMPVWAQTIQVGVRRTTQVVARPMTAPATGIIQVQAILNDDRGTTPLSGVQVWVDGALRGVTPTSLELPRGPHSLRLTWHGETPPVQVIDLPGGNQRFASFDFGLDQDAPQVIVLGDVHPANATEAAVVSATVKGLQPSDVREAWLHVRMPEGLWRRYPMNPMSSPTGPVIAAVFPGTAFDNQGQARWYVSASTRQGDEYFSEMRTATLASAVRPKRRSASQPAAGGDPTP
jgi:hypothetical protein